MTTVCTFKTSGLFVVDKKRLQARHVRQGNEDTLVHCYKLFGRWQDPAADEHTRLPFWERNVVTWGCFSAYVLQFRRCVYLPSLVHNPVPLPTLPYQPPEPRLLYVCLVRWPSLVSASFVCSSFPLQPSARRILGFPRRKKQHSSSAVPVLDSLCSKSKILSVGGQLGCCCCCCRYLRTNTAVGQRRRLFPLLGRLKA